MGERITILMSRMRPLLHTKNFPTFCVSATLSSTTMKQVRFEENTSINSIITIDRITDKREKKSCWYSRKEYKRIRKQAINTVMELKNLNGQMAQLNEDEYCLRGLEDACCEVFVTVEERIINSKSTQDFVLRVLEEQMSQRILGIKDPVGIKLCSKYNSQEARKRAMYLAKCDEKDAIEYVFMSKESRREEEAAINSFLENLLEI